MVKWVMPFARTPEGMIILGDGFWGRVNSCCVDRSVSFRVGGAAVAWIIVGAGPTSWGWCAVPHRHHPRLLGSSWARAPPHGGDVRCLIAITPGCLDHRGRGPHLMGVVCLASSPRTLPGVPVMYKPPFRRISVYTSAAVVAARVCG